MASYTPISRNFSDISIPPELKILMEEIAEHVHDVWAAARIKEGWTYGASRNDVLKQHPCLVPYNELPDTEKEYDRATAEETLKLVLSLGYTIIKYSN